MLIGDAVVEDVGDLARRDVVVRVAERPVLLSANLEGMRAGDVRHRSAKVGVVDLRGEANLVAEIAARPAVRQAG